MSAEAQENNENAVEDKKQDTREYNFAQIRKQLETEREEKARLAKEIEELRSSSKQREEDDEDSSYEEPYVDSKYLDKKLSKFEKRMQQQFESAAEQKAAALLNQERQKAFLKQNADFSEILTPELVEKFANKYPDIAEPMLEMPDNFARQKLLYQNIKALGLHKPEEPKQSIQDKINQNRKGIYYRPTGIANGPDTSTGDFSSTGQKSAYDRMKELQRNLRL